MVPSVINESSKMIVNMAYDNSLIHDLVFVRIMNDINAPPGISSLVKEKHILILFSKPSRA